MIPKTPNLNAVDWAYQTGQNTWSRTFKGNRDEYIWDLLPTEFSHSFWASCIAFAVLSGLGSAVLFLKFCSQPAVVNKTVEILIKGEIVTKTASFGPRLGLMLDLIAALMLMSSLSIFAVWELQYCGIKSPEKDTHVQAVD